MFLKYVIEVEPSIQIRLWLKIREQDKLKIRQESRLTGWKLTDRRQRGLKQERNVILSPSEEFVQCYCRAQQQKNFKAVDTGKYLTSSKTRQLEEFQRTTHGKWVSPSLCDVLLHRLLTVFLLNYSIFFLGCLLK